VKLKATALAAAAALTAVFAPAAAAKEFKPGDLRVCVATRCGPIADQPALDAIAALYYGPVAPKQAAAPGARARYVELRFRNGYVTGVAAGARFDRFLSFGVNLDQFAPRTWYRIPAVAAAEIRRLAAGLRPRLLPGNILSRSH
jgi:hypothetical protein